MQLEEIRWKQWELYRIYKQFDRMINSGVFIIFRIITWDYLFD